VEQATTQPQEMLTRCGFTTVFYIASVLPNTDLVRHRMASGKAKGPRILTVDEPFWVKGGTPVYMKGFLEARCDAVAATPCLLDSQSEKHFIGQRTILGHCGISRRVLHRAPSTVFLLADY